MKSGSLAGGHPAGAAILAALIAAGLGTNSWAQDSRVRISTADCRRVATYQPSPDVAYRPGVDVRGRRVAPADLDGGAPQIQLPDVITLDVKIDLSKYLPDGAVPGTAPEGSVGTVKFDLRTGRLTFNDQPLDDPAMREFQVVCQRVLSGR